MGLTELQTCDITVTRPEGENPELWPLMVGVARLGKEREGKGELL